MGWLGKMEIMLEMEHLIHKPNNDLPVSQPRLPLTFWILLYRLVR